MIQYNFRQIDEDIFGKACEPFLVEIRRETGAYYTPAHTPAYVSLCIVNQTIATRWDGFIKSVLD